MAISIHTSPELSGRTAELFVEEAENRPTIPKPLTQEEEALLERIIKSGRAFRETLRIQVSLSNGG